MYLLKTSFFFSIFITSIHGKISDKRLCADEKCFVPVSKAKSLLRYAGDDNRILSFAQNVDMTIYSKSAGSRSDLWGAEINGKRGYVPLNLVREYKILTNDLKYLVDTEESLEAKVNPDKIAEIYEIVDGTTITTYQKEIKPSSTFNSEATSTTSKHINATDEEGTVDYEYDDLSEDVNDKFSNKANEDIVEVQHSMDEKNKENNKLDTALEMENSKSSIENENTFIENVMLSIESSMPKSENNKKIYDVTEHTENIENRIESTTIAQSETIPEQFNEISQNKANDKVVNTIMQIDTTQQNEIAQGVEYNVIKSSLNVELKVNYENDSIIIDNLEKPFSDNLVNNLEVNKEQIKIPPTEEVVNQKMLNDLTTVENSHLNIENKLKELDGVEPDIDTLTQLDTNLLDAGQNVFLSSQEMVSDIPEVVAEKPIIKLDFTTIAPVIKESSIQQNEEINEDNNEFQTENVTEALLIDAKYDVNNHDSKDGEKYESSSLFSEILSGLFGLDESKNSNAEYQSVRDNVQTVSASNVNAEHTKETTKVLHESNFDYSKNCDDGPKENYSDVLWTFFSLPSNTFDILLYLTVTAATILLFSLGHYYIDRKRQEGPLVAKINQLQKALLIITKENQLLQESNMSHDIIVEENTNTKEVNILREELENLKYSKLELEEHVIHLERELETATETGLELNRMLSDFLNSQKESDCMMANVEKLQRQLVDQQVTINSLNKTVNCKDLENERLMKEINQIASNNLKIQDEKLKIDAEHANQIEKVTNELLLTSSNFSAEINKLNFELSNLQQNLEETERKLDLKSLEVKILQDNLSEIKSLENNSEIVQSLLNMNQNKAEFIQLGIEKQKLSDKLKRDQDKMIAFKKETEDIIKELRLIRGKYEECEKEKTEAQTRLEVLSTYFKEKEAALQKELNEQQSLWVLKQGEEYSTGERIKWMQDELHNYKEQNELLKREILSQEVDLKSQISILEKRSHESWISTRQIERKLEDAKQEAAQLRNRLTLMSNQVHDDKQRIGSPLEQNGDITMSPLHVSLESSTSPLIFPSAEHLPLPPPFMPPPPGVSFMPPLPGVPPFIPPPPSMYPGDHRPPPLGRMSSPPLHSQFSPSSRNYSPYDRDSPSPIYDEEDYERHSVLRGYSPFTSREYRHPSTLPSRTRRNHNKGPILSSGSGNSNESLDKLHRQSNI